MMLQIHHRVSFDIDIFLPDPQLQGLLDPDKNALGFETRPDAFLCASNGLAPEIEN